MEDLERFKTNPKTAYLYAEYIRIQNEEEETASLAKGDMAELAADDLARLAAQKNDVLKEMERILTVEEKEEDAAAPDLSSIEVEKKGKQDEEQDAE